MTPIAPDVWQLVGPALRLPGGVRMPLGSTVFRLPDGTLAIYSPIAIDDAMAAELARLGEVAHVIAPNRLHHLHVSAALARWPDAKLHAPPGLAAKRPDLAVHHVLGGDPDPAWQGVLDVEVVGGTPKIDEAVVFHRPSGTLACADFLFHVTRPANLRTRAVLALMGVGGGRLAQSRAWRFLRKDRGAARASVDRILAWPIAHVAPCHGEPLAIDAAGIAARVARVYGGRPQAALGSPTGLLRA
jgi:hypothetical protein